MLFPSNSPMSNNYQASRQEKQRLANVRKKEKEKATKESVPRMEMKPPCLNRLRDYDPLLVQKIWEDSIELDVDLKDSDPFTAQSTADYKNAIDKASKTISSARRKRNAEFDKDNRYTINRESFRTAPYSEQKVLDPLMRFESRMMHTRHHVCSSCNECSLTMSTNRNGICPRCAAKRTSEDYTRANAMIPTWTDDKGIEHLEVPEELDCLTIAEKLLIQLVSPLVPIYHVKNGTLGIKGHVCSFMQNIESFASSLPNLPQHVKAIRMIRTHEDSDGLPVTTTYLVNRRRVMNALKWLVKHHKDYKQAYDNGELTIDESNLDWIPADEDEADLTSVTDIIRTEDETEAGSSTEESGVSNSQCIDPIMIDNEEEECSGFSCREETSLTSENQEAMIHSLKESAGENSNTSVLDWPQTSYPDAISEYSNVRIFTCAFPWLFPGGIADFRDLDRESDIDVSNWAQHLLRQSDGRFQRDKLWGFFVYNYCQRHRNNSSGGYFVNSHISDAPKSLDDLKQQLEDGDTSFISKLVFYSKRVRGSDSFWRSERSKLYTWISHHIESGHGPPDIFMTLSCAEYFWPDAIRLLEERIWIAEGRNVIEGKRCFRDGRRIDLNRNKADRNRAVNDYALVIQQFFIKRAENFLNTVGKEVLGIDHYWGRMEFAKGRGQIHIHLLGILNKNVTRDVQDQLNDGGRSHDDQSKLIGDWAERVFGMSSSIDGSKK